MQRSRMGLWKAFQRVVQAVDESGLSAEKSGKNAVRVQFLLSRGICSAEVSLLVENGYLSPVGRRKGRRTLSATRPGPALTGQVGLTAAGLNLATQTHYFLAGRTRPAGFVPDLTLPATPTWHEELGVLSWGERIIQRFRRPAPNLVALLNALCKTKWSPWTPNPFRATAKHTGQYLLREAIKNWNKSPMAKFIRLHGDGSGTGFLWERLV